VKKDAVSVEIKNVYKSFGQQEVLHDISFDVAPGEIFVLMGPSGAGKSVLLKNIIGLDWPDKGKILVNGLDVYESQGKVVMGLVFQSGALLNSLDVFDNLALYPKEHRLYSDADIRAKVMHTLSMLSLEDAAHKYPSELSGGMRKRVSIARALVMEPQLLLYDEPTSELDPVMSATIAEVIATLKEEINVTSIVVSHDRSLAMAVANRVALMHNGRIHAIDTPKRFLASKDDLIRDFMDPSIDPKHPRFREKS